MQIDYNEVPDDPREAMDYIHRLIQSEHNRRTREKRNSGDKVGGKGIRGSRIEVNGVTYASVLESKRGVFLLWAEKNGHIKNFQSQPKIQLLPPTVYHKKKFREMRYTPDFLYEFDGNTWYEEVKGHVDDKFKMRYRILIDKYPDILIIIWQHPNDYLFPLKDLINRDLKEKKWR